MESLLVSIVLFMTTLFVHVVAYRKVKKFKSDTAITFLIFSIGLIISAVFICWLGKYKIFPILPLTSIFIYLLLSLIFIIFFLYTYLVEEGPSSTILSVLKKKRKIADSQIYDYFSDSSLIGSRMRDLIKQGTVVEKNKRIFIQNKGKLIATLINIYRKMLGWQNFG